ncbi:hypothetical protein ACSMXM_05720 [Pacificimonas sp. ICDLI1SI03]
MTHDQEGVASERPNFQYLYDAFSPETLTLNREPDDTYRKNNFDICRALNMTNMSVVLGRMVATGWLDKRVAELFHMQASSLLALILSENNREFASRKGASHDA